MQSCKSSFDKDTWNTRRVHAYVPTYLVSTQHTQGNGFVLYCALRDMGSENPMPDEILYCIPHEYVLVQDSRSFGCLCSQQILSSICIKVKVAHGRHLSNIKNKQSCVYF